MSTALDVTWLFRGEEDFKITVVRNSVIKCLTAFCIFVSVSYTHLDVYKRQLVHEAAHAELDGFDRLRMICLLYPSFIVYLTMFVWTTGLLMKIPEAAFEAVVVCELPR